MSSYMPTIILLISIVSIGLINVDFDESKSVELRWKLNNQHDLLYETTIQEVGEYAFDFKYKGEFYKCFNDDKSDGEDFFKLIDTTETEGDYLSTLKRSNDFEEVIEISVENTLSETIKLSGTIYDTGEIHSFWISNSQKNLISCLFQLPINPIKKGDKLKIEGINLISLGTNFLCEESEKKSDLIVADIYKSKINGERIVVINYDIYERVKGKSYSSFIGKESPKENREIKSMYKAQGKFSIERGKWISYIGFMYSYDSKIRGGSKHELFKLVERNKWQKTNQDSQD